MPPSSLSSATPLPAELLDALPFGAIVFDQEMHVVSINAEACTSLEVSEGAIQPGQPLETLIAELATRGDYGQGLIATSIAHLVTQVSTDGSRFTQTTPTGKTLVLSTRRFASGFLLLIDDLTHEDPERAALRKSAQQMRAILDSSPIAVAIVGPGGQLLYTNHKHDELYGVTADKMPENVRDLYVDPSRRDELLEIFHRDGQLINDEVELRRPDGGTFWSLLSWKRTEYDGQPVLISWISDISARKRAEAAMEQARKAAEQANRTKSDFLANMSHELRTPLNAIIGYSEMLMEDATDAGDQSTVSDLQKIEGAGKHLLGIINDILDLSKIEAGRMDVYLEPVFLPRLIEEVQTIAAPLLKKNANTLVVDSPSDIGSIRTDVTKLKQSLLNLLSNAAKFTKEGRIKLSLRRINEDDETSSIQFVVSDTGIGMSEAQVGRLFQAFSQADSSTTRNFGGTGLGLAITRHFCTMLGGTIDATSTAGQGSSFTIVLPDQTIQGVGVDRHIRPAIEGHSPGSIDVLVVDDDPDVHNVLSAMLTKEGYGIRFARDGLEALEMMRQSPPDIVTLDVMMPRMDGWSLLGIMKSDATLHHIPVVMVTIVDDRSLGYSLGASEYMTKPIDRARLISVIERFSKIVGEHVILVVDDDPNVRSLVRRTAEETGLIAAEAENGRVALEWLASHPAPALVLLDLMMPELDGFGFLERMRSNSQMLDIPVVVLTAKTLTEDERMFLAERTMLVLNKNAQPLGSLGRALAAIAKRAKDATHNPH